MLGVLNAFDCEYGRLDYDFRRASGAGHALVLLHGLGSSHKQFDFLVDAVDECTPILLIDLPGHGANSLTSKHPISFENFCNSILNLCDKLRLESADFAGVSMGSALALMCAARRPKLVRHLVVIRPSWLVSSAPEHLSLVDRCGQWLLSGTYGSALAQLEADPDYIEMREDVPLAAASIRGVFDRDHALAHAPVLSGMFNSSPFGSLNELRAIKTPTVVVGTHADSLHPVAVANATANALPDAEMQILPPRYLQPEKHQAALSALILEKTGVPA